MSEHSSFDRPSFIVDGKVYVSAGVLVYTIDQSTIWCLLQHITDITDIAWDYQGQKWEWEDFGGKSEHTDQNIKDVAFRECSEETNGVLTREFLDACYSDSKSFQIRVPEYKYIVYVIYVPPSKLSEWNCHSTNIFGDTEQSTGIKRIIRWITYAEVINHHQNKRLHPRMTPVIDILILKMAMAIKNITTNK